MEEVECKYVSIVKYIKIGSHIKIKSSLCLYPWIYLYFCKYNSVDSIEVNQCLCNNQALSFFDGGANVPSESLFSQ